MAYRAKLDRARHVEFASEGAFELTGYGCEQLEKETVCYGSLIHADDRDVVWDRIQKSLREKTSFKLIYRIHDREGKEKWVWEQGTPLFNESGRSHCD